MELTCLPEMANKYNVFYLKIKPIHEVSIVFNSFVNMDFRLFPRLVFMLFLSEDCTGFCCFEILSMKAVYVSFLSF